MRPGEHESGFRRLPNFRRALLAADVARLCGDWPAAWTPPPDSFIEPKVVESVRRHFSALDAVAARLARNVAPIAFLDRAPAKVFFFLAEDVPEPSDRVRAIIARAYARADAVAWGLVQADEDARRRNGQDRPAGRPEATIARTRFVMRLAVVWSLMTGESPAFEGGDESRGPSETSGPRRRGSAWHDLVNSALGLTQAHGGVSTDTVLRAIPTLGRPGTRHSPFERLPARFFSDQIRALAAASDGRRYKPLERYVPEQPLTSYGDLPEVGIEIDACLSEAPTTREAAYRPPSDQYAGLPG